MNYPPIPHLLSTGLLVGSNLQAETCFEIFARHGSTMESLQCAENAYFANTNDFSVFIDLANAASGPFAASHNGLTIFGTGDEARPASLLAPFSASTNLNTLSDAAGITKMQVVHTGNVSSRVRNIDFQTATFESKSRVAFRPIKTGSPGASIPLTIQLAGTFFLQDNASGGSTGACVAGTEYQVVRSSGATPSFTGALDLDLAIDPAPNLFGDLTDTTTVTPDGPGRFRLAVSHTTTFNVTEGELMAVDSATNGNIFTDGFESGDPSIWSAATSVPFVFTINSSDPGVRFEVIPEPPPSGGNNFAQIVDWRQTDRTGDNVTFHLEWLSEVQVNYAIDFSRDGQTWTTLTGNESVSSQGARTSRLLEIDIDGEPNALIRVRKL